MTLGAILKSAWPIKDITIIDQIKSDIDCELGILRDETISKDYRIGLAIGTLQQIRHYMEMEEQNDRQREKAKNISTENHSG